MDTLDAIRARRSVKDFTERPLAREELEPLLELAALAPNHRMTEPWGFIVLGPKARRAYGELKGESRARRLHDPTAAEAVRRKSVAEMEALPAMVAFTQRLDDDPAVREEDFASVYMAIQNFSLGAVAVGLGTHVKTGAVLEEPATRELLGVGEKERVVALVHVGEPRETPDAKARAPAVERTRWLP